MEDREKEVNDRWVKRHTAQYAEVYTRGAVFGQCVRCAGAGHRAHDVAPWVAPVAPITPGLAPAEVDVCCDACGGSGMTWVERPADTQAPEAPETPRQRLRASLSANARHIAEQWPEEMRSAISTVRVLR